jgi:hypothetical protein
MRTMLEKLFARLKKALAGAPEEAPRREGKKVKHPGCLSITCPLCGALLRPRAETKEPQILDRSGRPEKPGSPHKSRGPCHIAMRKGTRKFKVLCPKQFGGVKDGSPRA